MQRFNKTFLILAAIGVATFLFSWIGWYECPFRATFHIPCGGCGMTAAIAHLLEGEWSMALWSNLLVLPMLLLVGYASVLFVIDAIKQTTHLETFFNLGKKPWVVYVLAAAFLVSWVFNVLKYFQFISFPL